MSIEERIIRREQEDIIEIGRVLESLYSSEAGTVIRAIIQGLLTTEAREHWHNNQISGDRILGRIEGINKVREEIELGIQLMQQLTQPLTDTEENENG